MHGWAESARVEALFARGTRFSVLPALCSEGMIYSAVREGTYDGPAFITFIRNLLPRMQPWPAPRSVLVMENSAIHRAAAPEVRELCDERGVRLYYLPPYSPELNPVEEAFSHLKEYLRQQGDIFRLAVDFENGQDVLSFIHMVLGTSTPELAQDWMRHSGYL